MNSFLEFVANVFDDDVKNMNLDLKYGEYAKWDSLSHLKLIMEVEEEYGIDIPFDQIAEIRTLRDLYSLIERR